jgi:hypothetical protein
MILNGASIWLCHSPTPIHHTFLVPRLFSTLVPWRTESGNSPSSIGDPCACACACACGGVHGGVYVPIRQRVPQGVAKS